VSLNDGSNDRKGWGWGRAHTRDSMDDIIWFKGEMGKVPCGSRVSDLYNWKARKYHGHGRVQKIETRWLESNQHKLSLNQSQRKMDMLWKMGNCKVQPEISSVNNFECLCIWIAKLMLRC
jgi:hypothetical protein